ncbi:hypothetical protein ACP70R_008480 [Stipagrostis hirtigluma subsp. patula]
MGSSHPISSHNQTHPKWTAAYLFTKFYVGLPASPAAGPGEGTGNPIPSSTSCSRQRRRRRPTTAASFPGTGTSTSAATTHYKILRLSRQFSQKWPTV